jgi:hypothetical protein
LGCVLILGVTLLAGCGDGIPDQNGYGTDGTTTGNYFSVVGYYDGEEKAYKTLGVSKLDECRARAIVAFNSINSKKPGRAFDWYCKNTHSGRIDR